jgi:hypothetical protein
MPPKPNTINEAVALRHGVPRDSELTRIIALPRRVWSEAQTRRVAAKLTTRFKRKQGTQELWPEQGVALREIEKYGGIAGGIKVSGGKTLISFLAPSLYPQLERPLLICPSKSVKTGKVLTKYREARAHWKVRKDITWISYHALQSKAFANYLDTYKPQIIILDEAHHAGRYNSSRTKRISRYIAANPGVLVIVLTGSLIASRVVNDSLTLCYWARREQSPLPLPTTAGRTTARYWRMALELPARCRPGVLRELCNRDERTLAGVGRRYRQTPGIVCSSGKSNIGASMLCETEIVTIRDQRIIDAVGNVRAGRMPDGSELLDPDGSNVWSTTQTLALGFYYAVDPAPPSSWLRAYRNWCAHCRETLADESNTFDTERQYSDTLERGECWPWDDWCEVRNNYRVQRKAVWLSDERLRATRAWMRAHKHGIVWSQFKAFGQALDPYYGSHARDAKTRKYILQHPKGTACVASVKVCSEDLDLQYLFYENLFPAPFATGAWHEQACARTHRYGQPEGEVTARYWIACTENKNALSVARAREAAAATLDGHTQRKLLIAEWSEARHKIDKGNPLWQGKKISSALMV